MMLKTMKIITAPASPTCATSTSSGDRFRLNPSKMFMDCCLWMFVDLDVFFKGVSMELGVVFKELGVILSGNKSLLAVSQVIGSM